MAVSKRTRVILIVGVLAVVAYFAWQWYQNRQASTPAASDGTNLNSAAPVLEGGSSSGDNSAPSYSTGQETINVQLPDGSPSLTGSSSSGTTAVTGTTGIHSGFNPGRPIKVGP